MQRGRWQGLCCSSAAATGDGGDHLVVLCGGRYNLGSAVRASTVLVVVGVGVQGGVVPVAVDV
jgi:hypothetical protein